MTPRARVAAMLSPVLFVVVALFGLGFAIVLLQSLGVGVPGAAASPGAAPTLRYYGELARSAEFYRSLGLTVWIAAAATTVAVVGGVALALLLDGAARRRRLLYALIQVPLAVPHLAMAVVTVTLLAQSGLVARLAYALGLIDGPAGFPALVYDRWGAGTLASYAAKEIPFIAVVTTALLARVGADYDA